MHHLLAKLQISKVSDIQHIAERKDEKMKKDANKERSIVPGLIGGAVMVFFIFLFVFDAVGMLLESVIPDRIIRLVIAAGAGIAVIWLMSRDSEAPAETKGETVKAAQKKTQKASAAKDSKSRQNTQPARYVQSAGSAKSVQAEKLSEVEEARAEARSCLIIDLIWFACGLASSIVLAMLGTGMVAAGAMLIGGMQAVRGLIAYIKVSR